MSIMADKPPKKPKRTTKGGNPKYPSRENYTGVIIPKALADQVRVIAEEQDRSVSYLVRKAVERWLEEYRKPKS